MKYQSVRLWFIWLVMAEVASLGGNLIVNPEFAQGLKGWTIAIPGAVRARGGRMTRVEGGMRMELPAGGESGAPTLLINQCRLPDNTLFELSYDLEVEEAGVMRHLYQLSQPPYSIQGCVRNTPVKPGLNHLRDVFVTHIPDSGKRCHLTFNVSRLQGQVRLSNVVLKRTRRLSHGLLGKEWKAFLGVRAPADLSEVPSSLPASSGQGLVRGVSCRLDSRDRLQLHVMSGDRRQRERRCAMLYQAFESSQSGVLEVGMSADWWMAVYLNGELVYDTLELGNGSQAYVPDDHDVKLMVRKGRNVLAVKVLSGSAGWSFTCGFRKPHQTVRRGPDWLPVDMSRTHIREGSALDMSHVVEAPAGKFGRVSVNGRGELVFAGRPDRPLRLQGFNGFRQLTIKDDREFRVAVRSFAETARRQGYSLFRVNGLLDSSLMRGARAPMALNPQMLDRWDYLLSEFKKQGIYLHLVVLSYNLYGTDWSGEFKLRNSHRLMLYLGRPWERERFRYGAETLLNHVNPYTGLAWKDDPAIAFVEFYNEQGAGFGSFKENAKAVSGGYDLLMKRWHDWLAGHYKDGLPSELKKALGGTPLAAAPLPDCWGDKFSPLSNAFGLFRAQMMVDGARWCEAVVRRAGYRGLTTNYNAMKRFGEQLGRWQCVQVVDMHSYYQHPMGGWGAPGCRVGQDSSLSTKNANGWWRGVNACRLLGRPMIVSEFNHAFWNPYQHEGGLAFSAYSAFQGYGSVQIHEGINYDHVAPALVGSFSVGNSPIVRANEFLANCLYARGDVSPARGLVDYVMPRERLETGGMSNLSMGREQSLISLLTGFGMTFPWAPVPPEVGRGPRADVRILPEGSSDVQDADWYFNVIENAGGAFELDRFVGVLRSKGILPAGNRTDVSHGVYESETGEIMLRTEEQLLKVVTPRSEGVSLKAQVQERLGCLTVDSSSVHATVALCAVDGKPVETSSRLVLVYATRCLNEGTVFSHDGSKKIAEGHFPILLRRGTLRARFKPQSSPETFALYALDFDGSRRERIPLTVSAGQVMISLDTGALLQGPTTFFELVRD